MGGNMFGDDGGKGNAWQNNNNKGATNGRWSKKLRDYVYNACLQEVGQTPQANEKCDCWVGKLEAKLPNTKNPNEISEEISNQLAMDCMQQFGGTVNNDGGFNDDDGFGKFDDEDYSDYGKDKGYNDDGYGEEDFNNGNYKNRPAGGRTWAAAERQQWMMGCTTSAQQSLGISQQQANAYCDCLTRKVEAKHSFAEAVKMTVQDFSTPEWNNARMECQMNLGY